jgi:RHS repeat-associated protein
VREYIWLYETEIAPTMGSRTVVDRPLTVVESVNTASPILYYVHVDQLHRPVKMTNAAKATVWDAVWQPWGGVHSITGAATLTARFPGQWFQTETGLHYNWHRSYDPTLGRYTQPDPLGFVDGPSVYGYVNARPLTSVDFDGRIENKSGKMIECSKRCRIRINSTRVNPTAPWKRHVNWECRGKSGAFGESGEKSHGQTCADAPQEVIDCAQANGFQCFPPPPQPERVMCDRKCLWQIVYTMGVAGSMVATWVLACAM